MRDVTGKIIVVVVLLMGSGGLWAVSPHAPVINSQANSRPSAAEGIEGLVGRLSQPGSVADRLQAAEAIARYGSPAVPDLVKLLRQPDLKGRQYACVALVRLGPQAEAAVPALMESAADPADPVRMEAILALSRIGPSAAAAVPVLRSVLRDEHQAEEGELTGRVLEALEAIGSPAVPALVEALQSRSTWLRSSAAHSLQQIGPEAVEALPALVEAGLDSTDDEVSDAVFLAISALGPAAVEDLVRILDHPEPPTRRRASLALSRLGPAAGEALPVLQQSLSDPDPIVRLFAARGLTQMGPAARPAIDALIRALSDPDDDVRWQAALALGKLGDSSEPVQQALQALLDDPHPAVQTQAETVLMDMERQRP